ncbi:hypothetical protein CN918_27755 [Priestia megaterium]|nr:hypothetical protein CN918_27755 [Priestia megaterium]
MKNNIKEKYRANTIDEILELIEVDKRKYNAKEQILKKKIKRQMPLFWKKDYIYTVEYQMNGENMPVSFGKRNRSSSDKAEILNLLSQEKEPVQASNPLENIVKDAIKQQEKKEISEQSPLHMYEEKLIDCEIKEDIAKKIIIATQKELMSIDYENKEKIEEELVRQMTILMGDTFMMDLANTKKIVLIGPTGVGKTTTIGKLAAILTLKGKRIGLITTDIYRMGAAYQLNEYAKIVNSTMEPANTPVELEEAINYFENVEKVDHILIDTVGRSPMDAGNIDDMKSYLDVAKPDHVSLVLSCTQKEKDIYQIIENFKKANVTSLIFTKLDETMNHGVIMNVIVDKKVNVSFITNGQDVPQDIYIAETEKLANKLLRGVDDFERPSI